MDYLSKKSIPSRERLIFALDVPTVAEGKEWVEKLGDSVVFYKLGLQLFMAGGYYEFIDWLAARGKKIFADLKFFDVPETVKSAVAQLQNRPITFVTVHGNGSIMEAAASVKKDLKILAVTVLTSLDQKDIESLGFQCNVEDLVLSRAKGALETNCDGIISSGLEAARIREHLGDKLLIISPGIRPVLNKPADDQKRTMDIEDAFRNGADYIVVGRPIRQAPDPRAKAEEMQQRIAALFNK
jgi:orotidine-5'-phosphate decarboxylase